MITHIIDRFHLEDIKNALHPSIFYTHEAYDLFILRLPYLKEEKIEFMSEVFVMTEMGYYRYVRSENRFNDLGDIKGFYRYLDRLIDTTMKIVSGYFSKLADLEDTVYEEKRGKYSNKTWFLYKNDMIRISRVLYKSIEALENMIYTYKKEADYLERNFEDIHEHLQRAYRNAGLILENSMPFTTSISHRPTNR